jgi:hypothetical protein
MTFCFLQRLSVFLGGFRFPWQLSAFLNGFLLSSMAFCFPWWLFAFLNGFSLSLAAYRFPQWLSIEGVFSFPFFFD